MIIFLLMLSLKAVPLASEALQGTLNRYSLYAKTNLPDDQRVIVYGINNPSIVFYSGHKIINAGSKNDVKAALDTQGKISITITKTKNVEDLKELGFNIIERDKKYALLERKQ
jgi:maleate cis-trans isomerase